MKSLFLFVFVLTVLEPVFGENMETFMMLKETSTIPATSILEAGVKFTIYDVCSKLDSGKEYYWMCMHGLDYHTDTLKLMCNRNWVRTKRSYELMNALTLPVTNMFTLFMEGLGNYNKNKKHEHRTKIFDWLNEHLEQYFAIMKKFQADKLNIPEDVNGTHTDKVFGRTDDNLSYGTRTYECHHYSDKSGTMFEIVSYINYPIKHASIYSVEPLDKYSFENLLRRPQEYVGPKHFYVQNEGACIKPIYDLRENAKFWATTVMDMKTCHTISIETPKKKRCWRKQPWSLQNPDLYEYTQGTRHVYCFGLSNKFEYDERKECPLLAKNLANINNLWAYKKE